MKKKPAVVQISIEGEFSIVTASALRQQILAAFDTGREVEIDLAQVSEADSAGVQLMVAAQREATARNRPLRFTRHSQAVLDILRLYDLADRLGESA